VALPDVLMRWFRRLFPAKPLGQRGEAAAVRFLKHRGYRIVSRNERIRGGELDLVAVDRDRTIVFVEVKARNSQDTGHPAEAVDIDKQRRLTVLAVKFLKRNDLLEYPSRFDVIAVTWPQGKWFPEIEHFKDAFEATGKGGFHS